MGCSKNLVDSEQLMRRFEQEGYHCVHDPKRPAGDIAVINTCGFIEAAKEESINTILEFVDAKQHGKLKKLFVMGCLSQRYRKELEESIPEVDKFYGKFDYRQLLQDLGPAEVEAADTDATADQQQSAQANKSFSQSRVDANSRRKLTTPHHYAYIKIAEGCDRHCAYCAIPLITGKHISRPIDDILNEVQ